MGLGLRGLRFRTLASHFADALWAQFVNAVYFQGWCLCIIPKPRNLERLFGTPYAGMKNKPWALRCLSCVLSVVLCVRSIVLLLLLQVGRGIVMHVVVPSIPDFKPIYTKPS